VRSQSKATQLLFAQLWAFATYSGVGAMTTHGLGAIEIEF
jgi:CRISPR/Cas system endoribonuclease Cas6 (RAMP superfamily)